MNYVTYHEWCKFLRDAALIDKSAGKLARVANQSGIPPDRLEAWLSKQLQLSHAEFISLHEVLSETHVLNGSESDAAAKTEEPGNANDPHQPQQCGCSTCEDNDVSFDPSN